MRIIFRLIDILLRAFISSLICLWLVPIFSGVGSAVGYGQMVATLVVVYAAETGYAVLNDVLVMMLNAQIRKRRCENEELQKILEELRKGGKDE